MGGSVEWIHIAKDIHRGPGLNVRDEACGRVDVTGSASPKHIKTKPWMELGRLPVFGTDLDDTSLNCCMNRRHCFLERPWRTRRLKISSSLLRHAIQSSASRISPR